MTLLVSGCLEIQLCELFIFEKVFKHRNEQLQVVTFDWVVFPEPVYIDVTANDGVVALSEYTIVEFD